MAKLKTILYWLVSFTWGILVSLPGLIVFLVLGKKKRFTEGPCICLEAGYNWTGITLGPFVILPINCDIDSLVMGVGHSLQNIIYGPIYLFIYAIPTAAKYLTRVLVKKERYLGDRLSVMISSAVMALIPFVFITVLLVGVTKEIWPALILCACVIYILVIAALQIVSIVKYSKGKSTLLYNPTWLDKQASRTGRGLYYNW